MTINKLLTKLEERFDCTIRLEYSQDELIWRVLDEGENELLITEDSYLLLEGLLELLDEPTMDCVDMLECSGYEA